jgi:hypothetical protein
MKSSWILVCLLLLFSLSVYAQEFSITIDAQKDAFYSTLTGPDDGWVWIPSKSYNNNGTADDPGPVDDADLSANFYAAWDDTYLYVYEEVTDNIVNVDRGDNYWRNDCLDAKMDPDPTGINNNTVFCFAMTPLDSVDVPADAIAGVSNIVQTVGGGWADTTNSGWPHPEDYARTLTDNGYILEMRLKWAWIATSSGGVIDKGPIFPAEGNTYGFAISNHDNDGVTGNGRDNSIEWAATLLDAVWNTCSDMGYIQLLPNHKIKFVAESLRDPTIINPNPDWYIPTPSAVSQQSAVVKDFALRQNYPNPFNPSTKIEFSVPKSTFVTLKVFNLLGEEVATLASQELRAGLYTVDWNASNAPSGVYFYRLTAGSFVDAKRMLLLR